MCLVYTQTPDIEYSRYTISSLANIEIGVCIYVLRLLLLLRQMTTAFLASSCSENVCVLGGYVCMNVSMGSQSVCLWPERYAPHRCRRSRRCRRHRRVL